MSHFLVYTGFFEREYSFGMGKVESGFFRTNEITSKRAAVICCVVDMDSG